jgi:ATPase subunit of ABC transporter with duplicated ATPase domains
LRSGEEYALDGENGAGKSTTVRRRVTESGDRGRSGRESKTGGMDQKDACAVGLPEREVHDQSWVEFCSGR